jgi:signal transduction histidine kinase
MSTMPATSTSLLRVALADDTPQIRHALRLSLEFDGRFKVVGEAADGAEAIRLATVEQPHVVLLDLAMPVMDGLQAIPHIRRAAPETRIVVLSGFPADKMAQEALSRGAHRYVVKGTALATLTDELIDLCGHAADPAEQPAGTAGRGEERQAELLHELRKPLGAIKGLAATLRSSAADIEPEQLRAVADALLRNTETINGLLGELLAAEDGIALARIRSDFATLVQQELAPCVHAAEQRLVRVTLADDVHVRCDPVHVRRIVSSLLDNAMRHTPEDSPFEVVLSAAARTAELSVLDFGPGMRPEQAQTVFDSPPSGRGLAVSQVLARAHGGDLRVELPGDGGCRFVLTLPLD